LKRKKFIYLDPNLERSSLSAFRASFSTLSCREGPASTGDISAGTSLETGGISAGTSLETLRISSPLSLGIFPPFFLKNIFPNYFLSNI